MQRRVSHTVVALGFMALASVAFAQQPPAGRGAAPQGRGQAAAPAPAPTPPPLMFKEDWKQPPYTGALNDENRRVTQDAVTNPRLDLKLYGADVRNIGVYNHENRFDLWNGMSTSPVAVTLRDKGSYIDLTGLARLRWVTRTNSLHLIHPVVKLADGTYLAGHRGHSTDGDFLQSEVAFSGMRWFKLDPATVVTTVEVRNPDLTKVDEIGFADLMPGGGHGIAGHINVSTIEVFAKPVPR